MQDLLIWVQSIISMFSEQNLLLSVLLFILINTLFAMLFLPCSVFAVTAGLLWGIWPGILISQAGAMFASLTLFFIGRTAKHRKIPDFISNTSIFNKIKSSLNYVIDDSKLSVIAFQTNPLVPASSFSFLFGTTNIHTVKFAVLTYFSTLPLHIILVSIGATLFDIVFMNQIKYYTILCLFGLSAIFFLVLIKLKTRSINKEYKGEIR